MAYVSSSGLAASSGAAGTGIIARLASRLAAAWAAHRSAAEQRRAFAEVLALTCPTDRARLLAEYEIAASRQGH
jgi:hypothetical protein